MLTYGLCFCSGNGLGPEDRSSLLASCVSFLSVPVDADALNAVLRLCLRFTQDFRSVLQFQTQTQLQQAKLWFYKLPPAELATARFSKISNTAMQQHGEKMKVSNKKLKPLPNMNYISQKNSSQRIISLFVDTRLNLPSLEGSSTS